MNLTLLPSDIVILVLEILGPSELAALSLTCRTMHFIVTEIGWTSYLRAHPRPSCSLSQTRFVWSPRIRVRYDVMSDAAWDRSDFIARPLSRMWPGKLQPILAISASRLIVAAGSNLYCYTFGQGNDTLAPSVIFEGQISLLRSQELIRNITGITFVDDGCLDRSLHVAFQDGAIEHVVLTQIPTLNGQSLSITISRTNLNPMPSGDFVESLSSEANSILSLSANGYVRLGDHRSEHVDSMDSVIELKSRSWVSHLCLQSSTPYAAFGTASTTPLNVYPIIDGQLSSRPLAILHTRKGAEMPVSQRPSSAVYGVTRGPLNSPWGSSPQILVSGWFDGQVRCYDLRSSSRSTAESSYTATAGPAALRPVLSLADRWSYEPIYSVSCGGGSASHIAAGTARHSVVSFWDVRSPTTGWSVHAPGNDSSPVYSVVLESSRLFGVTQSRPFVYDFGPGVTMDTYPPIPQASRGIDNLKQKKGSNRLTYHVLRYAHNSSGLCNEH
ncbi:hypothetical protein B0H34DRAFT_782887 [Crassisporium funariophilum]|nr:hypothetical protein B0H34DRAFT_782887 [Crassisporium funariophilum]